MLEYFIKEADNMGKVFTINNGRNVRLLDELVRFSSTETPKVLIIPHSQFTDKTGEGKVYQTIKKKIR